MTEPKVHSLVLDATPLITQHVSTLQTFATQFFTTPTVYNEIKDENAKRNLVIWGDKLQVRHPKPEFIKKVTDFSKLTGDHAVLSTNDIHIIALTYELEVELNNGDWRLRKFPGEKKEFFKKKTEESVNAKEEEVKEEQITETPTETEPVEKKKKQRRRGGKKVREKRLAAEAAAALEGEAEQTENVEESGVSQEEIEIATKKLEEMKVSETVDSTTKETDEALGQEYSEDEDDGEWITSDNLIEVMIRDSGEKIEGRNNDTTKIKAALVTGDFAVQNVSMQIGLNLMNTMSGLQIRRVRNYMLRCHACFTMLPIPKNGRPKHFCPRCGGATLLRCAVSVDSKTGDVTPHLKSNFEWHKRGDRFSIASPLSKNTLKKMGNKGYVHSKTNKQREIEEPILREDQKEYQKALKDDDWLRRQNEKILNDYIGGGSADNFISPFVAQTFRNQGVKVGKGRFVNSNNKRKK